MAINRITISIPEQLMLFVTWKVEHSGYGSVSEYFRELVRREQNAELAKLNGLEQRSAQRSSEGSPAQHR